MEGPLPELSTLLSCMVGVGERVLHLGGRAFASGHTSGAKEASSRTRYGVFGNCGSWSWGSYGGLGFGPLGVLEGEAKPGPFFFGSSPHKFSTSPDKKSQNTRVADCVTTSPVKDFINKCEAGTVQPRQQALYPRRV